MGPDGEGWTPPRNETRRARRPIDAFGFAINPRDFSRFGQNGRTPADNIPCNDVRIGERMWKWAISLSLVGAFLGPDQDMVNFPSAQLEVGRTASPPTTPYVVADSLGVYPWIPAGGPARRPSRSGGRGGDLLTDLRATGMFL